MRTALESEGLRVFESETLQRGLIEAGTRKPDLIILDLGLPDGDGLSYIRDLRQWSAIPVIVLSARNAEEDKIAALDAGADDYLSKPFGIGELLARVRVALRRHSGSQQESPLISGNHRRSGESPGTAQRRRSASDADRVSPVGGAAGQRRQGDHPTPAVEPRLGPNYVEHSHYLRIYMGHLRQKLEADPARPKHLLTETGVGYRFMP